ncbi:hypothetical protein DMH17_13655 [Raoultella planticola]|nr:hypothetical protein [Raoultella planticola]
MLALAVRANSRYYAPSFQNDIRRDKREIFLHERVNSLWEYEVLRYFVAGESISQIAEKN